MKNSPIYLLILLFFLTACPGEDPALNDDTPDAGPTDDVIDDDVEEDVEDDEDVYEEPVDHPLATCDDLDPTACAFPWPSNLYLAPDQSRATGYRLQFDDESLPKNIPGRHVAPELFEHLDGYDLGVPIMVRFPNLDDSQLPDEYAIEESMDDDASILLFQVGGGQLERVPYWAELDRLEENPQQRTLFIRPAIILEPGSRYVVALRDLQDLDGNQIEPSQAFTRLVEGDTDGDDVLAHRQERFDDVFALLDDAGHPADSLTLAWDFVTASSEAIHGPVLSIREDAFDYVDENGISWQIEEVIEFTDDQEAAAEDEDLEYDANFGLELRATIEVPHYLEPYGLIEDAWRLHRDDQGQVQRNGTRQADILVRIPRRALEGDTVGIITYGHGLLGSRWEIYASHLGLMAQEFGFVMVAVDMIGMSHQEGHVAEQAAADVNHFSAMADRLHQGILEYMLAAHTAAKDLPNLEPITSRDIDIDGDDLHYFGGSQGGIFGATFMALSPDVERGYLAVPGNNYSTLLHRSVNFDDFNLLMGLTYSTSANLNINIALLSLMWSHSDPVSYLRHIAAEPFDGDPRQVLLAQAKGDWQVATITNEVVARSGFDIPLMENYDETRQPYAADVATYPHQGSATINFDFGNPWPEPGNLPPSDNLGDPHGWLATVFDHGVQIDHFLRHGEIIDICDGEPCRMPAP